MIQDPTNWYIALILSQCDIRNKTVLEIGCGKGRVTRDLAHYAKRVVATDPDGEALEQARSAVPASNVEFLREPGGVPNLPEGSFDLAIYTLSLHHIPVAQMRNSLRSTARLVAKNGVIVVIEPGDGGSFMETKERFGAGSGDERPERVEAIRAMHALQGWTVGETVLFRILVQFDNAEDFLASMMPECLASPEPLLPELRAFLALHRTPGGIVLDAQRRLNLLRPSAPREAS